MKNRSVWVVIHTCEQFSQAAQPKSGTIMLVASVHKHPSSVPPVIFLSHTSPSGLGIQGKHDW